MRPALKHAARSITDYAALSSKDSLPAAARRVLGASGTKPVCLQCQLRAFSVFRPIARRKHVSSTIPYLALSARHFTSSSRFFDVKREPEDSKPTQTENASEPQKDAEAAAIPMPPPENEAPKPTEDTAEASSIAMPPPEHETPNPDASKPEAASTPLPPPETEAPRTEELESEGVKAAEPRTEYPKVTPAPKEQLPSHWESQRNMLHKKFNAWMDELLPQLATATQKLNHYTGTDYSGIEALRQEIKQQESLVRSLRQRVKESKAAVDEALSQQSSSQKEVVGLLERKHSWSAADLERYMSLIRSEHLNEQAVRTAKEAVVAEERALEEARAQLEKRERAQYHEEQIWSDTIRRNSTWVTFGLMGVNILLLLVQLVVMEPWRRRRMVKEIRNALEEKNAVPATAVAAAAPAEAPVAAVDEPVKAAEEVKAAAAEPVSTEMEKEVDKAVEPTDVRLEEMELHKDEETAAGMVLEADLSGPEPSIFDAPPVPAEPSEPSHSAEEAVPSPGPALAGIARPVPPPEFSREYVSALFESYRSYVRDMFSDRAVSMRKVDVTSAALQGAAAGAAFMAVILVVLRPN